MLETIYGVSGCYQLHSGNMDTRNFKNCSFSQRIRGYWNLAAHSGPPNNSTLFVRPASSSRVVLETIYGVSDCFQLRSGNMDTRNFKKRRLFLTNPVLLEFGGPRRTRKSFHVIYKTVIASRDVAEAIYGVLDCFQLRSGNMDTSNFKKLRLFQTNFQRCCKDQKRSFRLLSTKQRQHGHEKFQKKNCVSFGRIPGYWNLAAHSGPANHFTPFT